jgi:hypothetical protein
MSNPAIYAARPPSEVEWEDLLVRYEIGPRALHIALDDAADVAGDARTRVCDLLRALVFNEMWTATAFETMRTGARPPSDAVRIETMHSDPQAIYERYARLRGRNFAAVQRRGLEVWAWHADLHPHGDVSAHQLIQASVALDGETLAGVRAALKGAAV